MLHRLIAADGAPERGAGVVDGAVEHPLHATHRVSASSSRYNAPAAAAGSRRARAASIHVGARAADVEACVAPAATARPASSAVRWPIEQQEHPRRPRRRPARPPPPSAEPADAQRLRPDSTPRAAAGRSSAVAPSAWAPATIPAYGLRAAPRRVRRRRRRRRRPAARNRPAPRRRTRRAGRARRARATARRHAGRAPADRRRDAEGARTASRSWRTSSARVVAARSASPRVFRRWIRFRVSRDAPAGQLEAGGAVRAAARARARRSCCAGSRRCRRRSAGRARTAAGRPMAPTRSSVTVAACPAALSRLPRSSGVLGIQQLADRSACGDFRPGGDAGDDEVKDAFPHDGRGHGLPDDRIPGDT